MGNAGVAVGATVRREGFEESTHACLTIGLGSRGADCIRVLARWTLGVGEAGVRLDATS